MAEAMDAYTLVKRLPDVGIGIASVLFKLEWTLRLLRHGILILNGLNSAEKPRNW